MRAIYHPYPITDEFLIIEGEKLHHLLHVVRISVGDELLLLDGKGTQTLTQVEQVQKRSLRLRKLHSESVVPGPTLHLAIGAPKKEALESALRIACELGLRTIYLVRGEFSQQRLPDAERIQSILENALEQSNNPFLPNVVAQTWESLPWENHDAVYLFDSVSPERVAPKKAKNPLLIIGPEGGFSQAELDFFATRPGLQKLHLPTPILRTPTAVAAAVGFLLPALLDR